MTLVSPVVAEELAALASSGGIRWVPHEFAMEHLSGAFLVVAATNDDQLNASIVEEATRRGSLACDASSAERSQVIFGALLDAEGATLAVFTDGHDPARARDIRDRIGNALGGRPEPPPSELGDITE